ncbi:MAG TPA: glycine cleavage system protein GcvH [Polyangiaceae bacterium]|jgi:glycine cleavage system H protein|nr:glycine cleavage system protein GcvH [Polyangiaceae bacterium]
MSDKLDVRDGLLYTKEHEWASSKAEGLQVGITAYAVDQLGDITLVNIDLKVGDTVAAGKTFGTIESVKTLSDLFSPVSGKVVKINGELETKPELVNEDCYGKGWMIVISPNDAGEKDKLLSPAAYRDLLKSVDH